MEIEIDLKELNDFIYNKLPQILNKNSPSFTISAFILQTLLDKIQEEKLEYMIALHGCDDSTYIKELMTESEFEFLKELEKKFDEKSSYVCMPVMEIKPINLCDEYEIKHIEEE